MGYIGRQPTNAILTSDDIAAGSVSKDKVSLISDATAGLTVKGDNGSNDGYLQLNCRVNSHGIKLKSPPHSASQSYTLTFPSTSPVNGKVLQTDGSGNLSFASAGITEADGFRLIADMSSSGAVITNIERIDDATFSKMGTGMSQSSGAYTFPSTGLYQVTVIATIQIASSTSTDLFASVEGQVSSNSGGAYDTVFEAIGGYEGSNTKFDTIASSTLVNVTNASNFRFRFVTDSFSGGTNLNGNTDINHTAFFFIRLGDSQ